MVFKKGMVPHNKGKTRKNYEPLERIAKSKIGVNNPMFGKRPWNDKKGFEEFIGRKFTKLTVVEDSGIIVGHRHFRCLCDCGKCVIINGQKLKSGHTRSCGCIRRGLPRPTLRRDYGEANLNRLFSSYKLNAKKKELVFSLTKEEFTNLTKSRCYYCRCEPSQIFKYRGSFGDYIYNGVDRLDNDHGYLVENCVPCCMECNFKKGSQGHTFFLQWVKRVYENKFQLRNCTYDCARNKVRKTSHNSEGTKVKNQAQDQKSKSTCAKR